MANPVVDPARRLDAIDWQTRAQFVALAAAFYRQTGLGLKVRSALRTCAEQAEQYGIGRTYNLNSPTVTGAQGCQSWHVLGRAVDADPVDLASGALHGSCEMATVAGQLWEAQGGGWGGRFGGFGACGDQGHFEWHPGLSIASLCPNPAACDSVVRGAIQSRAPTNPLWWALGGVAVVVGAAWLLGKTPAARRAGLAF